MLMTSDIPTMLRLHRAMFLAREIDRVEQDLVKQGLAHFHVSGAGHESTALIADYLGQQDWLHLHYRDKALLLARGLPLVEFFRSLLATGPSHSAGRQMSAHYSARELNVASMVGPVGNNALHAVGNAQAVKFHPDSPVVICCVGDGTTQQGEFLEAVGEAVRTGAPVVFVIQNNNWAISTKTPGQTFFDLPTGPAESFLGLPIRRVDGVDLAATRTAFETAVTHTRATRGPSLLLMELERLSDHTNADDQALYRAADELKSGKNRDPLEAIRQSLRESQMGDAALAQLETSLIAEVAAAVVEARGEAGPQTAGAAKAPYPPEFAHAKEYRGDAKQPNLTMREALNRVLRDQLQANREVHLLGQDIEDPKGDVFGVTKGLSTAFPGRVRNAPLSESTIVGTSIGRALTGQRPVAFIQFADFLPLGFNQIISELGSMYWRTDGSWQAPVILMVSCGGYKAGLGPFHAQTLESILAHVPGIDVVMPSSAGDAAGLLNAAFQSKRPTVFLYPKSGLNLSDRRTSDDTARQFVAPGKARTVRQGNDLTLVTWGNPLTQSLLAAETLSGAGAELDLIDLRSISPWDEDAVLRSVRRTKRLLVVHEDNHTAGFGAEVMATVMEKAGVPVSARRVTRDDIHVPFQFERQIDTLPSYRRIMEAAAALLEFDLSWEAPKVDAGPTAITAIGSGPADDEVEVVELLVKPGDMIKVGDLVAVVEATKAAVDVQATVTGKVLSIPVEPKHKVAVGAPLMFVEADASAARQQTTVTAERVDKAMLKRRGAPLAAPVAIGRADVPVGVAGITGITGGRKVHNADLKGNWQTRDAGDIVKLTGIESRRWVQPGETVFSLAVSATQKLLDEQRLDINDIDLVIAATGTPDVITPSLACRVADAVSTAGRANLPAYDINAACSGYLYALAQARDYVSNNPEARVLVVTSEVLSPLLDQNDFNTAVLFADAATASLVQGPGHDQPALFTFAQPTIAGAPESGELLSVPRAGEGYIKMNGREVFADAVRAMSATLTSACAAEGISMDDIDLMVPHQANQRIIDAIARRSGRPAHSIIRNLGNTSSSTIPLALMDALPTTKSGDRLGLVAFGGGITYAAAIATVGSGR
ncbi:MAG TPA: beta-ketoacyl-ACP synthase 3 [Devosia sp.]|jgi:2-oxoisovalerate dehydrogenase E1 component|uniref:beta-ketoacyl-ACP synthase 3 n=1 Tax=Devosia sp. TaxID=1871048 RepID=UPI002DDD26C7|nr:beta-ketoacyl-ACP synthase 3 [Devosia sp.]HEV2517385.1 beta-ketoacyl-ACP synthase 3 [Devosia sp.]